MKRLTPAGWEAIGAALAALVKKPIRKREVDASAFLVDDVIRTIRSENDLKIELLEDQAIEKETEKVISAVLRRTKGPLN